MKISTTGVGDRGVPPEIHVAYEVYMDHQCKSSNHRGLQNMGKVRYPHMPYLPYLPYPSRTPRT